MFREKVYKGTKTGYSATNSSLKNYNISYNTNSFLTDLFCQNLLSFLNECGVDCSYNATTKVFKINKIPIMFVCMPRGTDRAYIWWYRPYVSTSIGGVPTTATTIYMQSFLYNQSTGAYEIRLRILGEPTTFFVLFIKSYVRATKSSSTTSVTYANQDNKPPSHYFYFGKAKDLLNKKDVSLLNAAVSDSFFVYNFDQNEEPVDNIRGTTGSVSFISSFLPNSDEKEEMKSKLPIIPVNSPVNSSSPSYYLCKGLYQFIANDVMPEGTSPVTGDIHTFFTINKETFWVPTNSRGIVKIVT